VARGLDPAAAASDAEGGQELADRAGAARTPDLGLAAQSDQDFELVSAGVAAEFVERHGKGIVKEFARRGKNAFVPALARSRRSS
jgi:hypothetical protein